MNANRDTTHRPTTERYPDQQIYAAKETGDWLTKDLAHIMNGGDFQAELLQSPDTWIAAARFGWWDWLEYIGRMPAQERMHRRTK